MTSANSQYPPATGTDSGKRQEDDLDLLGIVADRIAQDLGAALSLMTGYVDIALSEIPPESRARNDLQHVLATGDSAASMLRRLADFGQRGRPARQPLIAHEVVRETLDHFQRQLPPGVRLRLDIGESSAPLASHPAELRHLLRQLCDNALRALPAQGGEIRVRLDYFAPFSSYWLTRDKLKKCDYARLSVQDNGCGMDLATLEHLYSPFFSAFGGAGGAPGAGLGMTLVQAIVQRHEGRIFIDSSPGAGCRVDVCLPLDRAAAPHSEAPGQSAPRTSGPGLLPRHILVVDDESAIRERVSTLLLGQGYRVTALGDPVRALELFRRQPDDFALVLTDLIMPLMSGAELASALSRIAPTLPIVLSARASDKLTLAGCRQWGVQALLPKPFSNQALLDRIGETLPAGA